MKKVSVRTKCLAVGIAAVIVAIALFVGGMSMLDWKFEKLDTAVWTERTFVPSDEAVSELTSVSVDCGGAYVEVADGEYLSVEYEESDDTKYGITYDAQGKLDIRENKIFKFKMFEFHTPRIKITLPKTQELDLKLVNGKCELRGMDFDTLDIAGTNGNIKLTGVSVKGAATLKTVNGDIELKSFSAKSCSIQNTNGKIKVNGFDAEESLLVKTVNGDISLAHSEANSTAAESTNGKITIDEIESKSLYVKTVNGTIKAEKIESEGIELRTTNGAITATVIGDRDDYRINCKSTNGSVNKGYKSDGKYYIEASSVNGNIKLYFAEEGEDND